MIEQFRDSNKTKLVEKQKLWLLLHQDYMLYDTMIEFKNYIEKKGI